MTKSCFGSQLGTDNGSFDRRDVILRSECKINKYIEKPGSDIDK